MDETILYAILATSVLALIITLVTSIVLRSKLQKTISDKLTMSELAALLSQSRTETNSATQNAVNSLSGVLTENQKQIFNQQDKRIEALTQSVTQSQESLKSTVVALMKGLDERTSELTKQNEQSITALRNSLEGRFSTLREENAKSLTEIRQTVDEKLQKTLETRISQSFKDVSERLEQVYKGLGEMQALAVGVGDLKKVLSNVKTRGILGEIQLEAILEQMMAPEQYDKNIATVKGSKNFVEFAIKLPGKDDGNFVYLPIDAKFPSDAYAALNDAYDKGDVNEIQQAGQLLEQRIKGFAKDIKEKYISPPDTTDFAIMFLPTEGLYAEVVRRGLVEILQHNYKISVAGPTTMAALINSLQMGFKTLAIQKRSGEVWELLSAVKTEFDKFEDVLKSTQSRLDQANRELDSLVGTRTRAIQRKLKSVSSLPIDKAESLISDGIEEDVS